MAKLINEKTGLEVKKGDTLTNFRGETSILKSFSEPHKVSSTGKVYTEGGLGGKYPSVYGLKIVEHEFSNELEELLSSPKVIVSVIGR